MMVRQWMRAEGVELRVECEQTYKLSQRAQLDATRRRQARRAMQFHKMFDSYTNLLQHIFTNTDFWTTELKLMEKKYRCVSRSLAVPFRTATTCYWDSNPSITSLANRNSQLEVVQAIQDAQKLEIEDAKRRAEKDREPELEPNSDLKRARIRLRYLQEVSDIYQGNTWWIKQQLRQLARRLAVSVAEFEDALKRYAGNSPVKSPKKSNKLMLPSHKTSSEQV